jgi:cell wall-associated NlpC family hydrolase
MAQSGKASGDSPFDKRTTPFKDGMTDQAHEGLVKARSYVAGEVMTCTAPSFSILSQPDDGAQQWNQLLMGERFKVLERKHDYFWGQALRDGYVGYVRAEALSRDWFVPTHYVATLRTFVFARADLKSPIVYDLSLNALVQVSAVQGRFSFISDIGWVFSDHLSGFDRFAADWVSVAQTFLHAPYQWGGRESIGLDCSGLVQQSLYAAGLSCPRDTDMQINMGQAIDVDHDLKGLQRGDLIFWKGHVAIMIDDLHMIHANAHHMKVAIEPLAEAIERIERSGAGLPVAYRRL